MKSEGQSPRCELCGHKMSNHKPASKANKHRKYFGVKLRCTVPLSVQGPTCKCAFSSGRALSLQAGKDSRA
jgi:hypothetical protein